jgi:hypothetical protein
LANFLFWKAEFGPSSKRQEVQTGKQSIEESGRGSDCLANFLIWQSLDAQKEARSSDRQAVD